MGAQKAKVNQYNGLESDLRNFAKIIFIYESKIKFYSTEIDFETDFPNAFKLYKNNLQGFIKYATKNDIPNLLPCKTKTLYFTKTKNQAIDLCRHLRDSFSHALLKRNGSHLMITNKSKGTISSTGYLQHKSIMDFLKVMITEYEQ